MFCSKCGTQNPEGSAFCGSCGAAMGQTQTVAQPVTGTPNTAVQKATAKPIEKLIAVVLAVVIIIVTISIGTTVIKNNSVNTTTISAEDIYGRWKRLDWYKNNLAACAFMEDGRYVTFTFNMHYPELLTMDIPNDSTERWEFVGPDIIRITGMKGKDELVKIILNEDKTEAVLLYLDDIRASGGDIENCTEKLIRVDKFLEVNGMKN